MQHKQGQKVEGDELFERFFLNVYRIYSYNAT